MDWHNRHFERQANARMSDEEEKKGSPRDYPHAWYILVSLFDSNPAVEKSRNRKGILAEIFAWESHDYRYAKNVENSNKVTGGTRGQMLEYVQMRLRKKRFPQFKRCIKNHSEMYRSWWYVVRTMLIGTQRIVCRLGSA